MCCQVHPLQSPKEDSLVYNTLERLDRFETSSFARTPQSVARHLAEERVHGIDHTGRGIQDSLTVVVLLCLLTFAVIGVVKFWQAATKRFAGSLWGMETLRSEPSPTAPGIHSIYTNNYKSPRWDRRKKLNKLMHAVADGLKDFVSIACFAPRKRGRAEVDSTVKKRDLWSKGWSPIVLSEAAQSTLSEIDSCEHNSDIDVEMGKSPFETESASPFSIAPPAMQHGLQHKGTSQGKHLLMRAGVSKSFTCNPASEQSRHDEWRRVSCPMEHNEALLQTPLSLLSRRSNGDSLIADEFERASKLLVSLGDTNQTTQVCCLSSAGLHQRKERALSLPTLDYGPSSPVTQPERSLTPCSLSHRTRKDSKHQLTPFSTAMNGTTGPEPKGSNPPEDTQGDTIGADPQAKPQQHFDDDQLLDEEIRQNPILNVDFNKDVTIEACLGSGSAGVVYKALWRGEKVAVKVLIESCQTPEQLHTFYKEVKVLISLRHPNIVKFLGASMKPPHLCIIQALAAHGSLFHMLHVHHVRPEYGNLLHILSDIASAMAYCHGQPKPIVHRDLKTQNILLGEAGRALVADFGLAKVKERTFLQTGDNGAGTVAYMAPETFGGGPVDEKCDVYSFGIIMWECLTGLRPWHGVLPMQIVMAVAVEKQRPPSPRNCPKSLRQLMKECWAESPASRPSFACVERRLLSMLEDQDRKQHVFAKRVKTLD